jgi:streptomycin 6-kinase
VERFILPRNLVEAAARDARGVWMSALPEVVGELAERWSLKVYDPFQPGGDTAWVAPVEGPAGERLVLKVVWRHPEAEHEADGLAVWAGRGAVRLHAADSSDGTLALLLERCVPGTELRTIAEPDQDVVVAGLLQQLWVEPAEGHHFRPLSVMCEQWADRFDEDLADVGTATWTQLDPGLVREAMALFRELPKTAERETLLCTDLHAGNVLVAEREPWLAIDPKPYVGDPTYDPLQHMLNCEGRLRADPRALAFRMASLLDLDRNRLCSWLFARCVQFAPSWPWLAEVAGSIAPR